MCQNPADLCNSNTNRVRRDVSILAEGIELGVIDPPQIDGRRDLKALSMALLDQWTHVSMWYVPGGRLGEEQMARLYADMALRAVGATPQAS